MRLRVNVKQEDIDKGVKKKGRLCPIALAVKREHPLASTVVGPKTIHIAGLCGNLSQKAQKFVKSFDRGDSVKPSVFYFNIA